MGDIERDKDQIKERIANFQKTTQDKRTLYEHYDEFSTNRIQAEEDLGDACLICEI